MPNGVRSEKQHAFKIIYPAEEEGHEEGLCTSISLCKEPSHEKTCF